MTDEIVVGYQAMSQYHGGIWFFVREQSIALAYHKLGYKVRKCVAVPFDPSEDEHAISRSDRQHDTLDVCSVPDEGQIPSYREPAANR